MDNELLSCVVDSDITICAGDNCRQAFDFGVELREILEDALVLERVLCCFGIVNKWSDNQWEQLRKRTGTHVCNLCV